MRIYSIFNSIDGEVTPYYQGGFTTFVRFSGCNFGKNHCCSYCDTKYALELTSGREMSIEEVISNIVRLECDKVTITGGEPFFQRDELLQLLDQLTYNHSYRVSVETNGSYEIPELPFVRWIADYKCPSAGDEVVKAMDIANFLNLTKNDFVKFIIGDKKDYLFARQKMLEMEELGISVTFAFGIHSNQTTYNNLIHWLKEDKLYRVVINAQLHKLLNLVEEE